LNFKNEIIVNIANFDIENLVYLSERKPKMRMRIYTCYNLFMFFKKKIENVIEKMQKKFVTIIFRFFFLLSGTHFICSFFLLLIVIINQESIGLFSLLDLFALFILLCTFLQMM